MALIIAPKGLNVTKFTFKPFGAVFQDSHFLCALRTLFFINSLRNNESDSQISKYQLHKQYSPISNLHASFRFIVFQFV